METIEIKKINKALEKLRDRVSDPKEICDNCLTNVYRLIDKFEREVLN